MPEGNKIMVETGQGPTAQQLTFQESRWIQTGQLV